jgi:hypothetical protein
MIFQQSIKIIESMAKIKRKGRCTEKEVIILETYNYQNFFPTAKSNMN